MRRGGRAADSPASETKLARRRAQKIIHPRARGPATRGDGGGPNSRFRSKSVSFSFERRRVGHIDRKGQYGIRVLRAITLYSCVIPIALKWESRLLACELEVAEGRARADPRPGCQWLGSHWLGRGSKTRPAARWAGCAEWGPTQYGTGLDEPRTRASCQPGRPRPRAVSFQLRDTSLAVAGQPQ